MEKLEIRKMEMEDIPWAAAVEKENFSAPWKEESFREALEKKENIYLIALIDGKRAGYIGMWTVLDEGEITQVSVKKEYQGMHIGRRLMEALEEEGRKAGIISFFLEVRKSNVAAIHLYESSGFLHQGIRKNFYENPREDGILMHKSLETAPST